MVKSKAKLVPATTTTGSKSETESRDISEVSNAPAPQYDRGKFNEILLESLTEELRKAVNGLVRKAGSAGHVDEHGSWDFGVEYDRKRGECSSLNWDAYGIGRDCHTGQILALVQVRQFHRKKTGYWPQIRKNYFLLGTNEDASIFAHSVSANVVHAAIRKGADVIKAVQDWIFEGDYAGMLRQGDLAMIPCTRRPSAPTVPNRVMILEGSHRLKANVIRQNGAIFAKNPNLIHIPRSKGKTAGTNSLWGNVPISGGSPPQRWIEGGDGLAGEFRLSPIIVLSDFAEFLHDHHMQFEDPTQTRYERSGGTE